MYKLRTLSITLALLTPVFLAGCGGYYPSGVGNYFTDDDGNFYEDEATVGFFGPDAYLDGGYFGAFHEEGHQGGMGHMGGGIGGHGGGRH